jgi:exonuclease SbcC
MGKSTVLHALEYGLTGKADDTIDSYIRCTADEESQPKSARIHLTLRKDGVVGSVERKLGRTSSNTTRKLTWDGKEHTKAVDVDKILADLFGASQRAIRNTVFIPQGELDKVLFGTPKERETLFLKLLLLDHLEEVAKQAEKQVFTLSSGLQDYSITLDEISAQRRLAEGRVIDLGVLLQSSRDWSDGIAVVHQIITAESRCFDVLPAQILEANRAAVLAKEQLTESLSLPVEQMGEGRGVMVLINYPALTTPTSLEDIEAAVNGIWSETQELKKIEAALDAHARNEESATDISGQLSQVRGEIAEIAPLVTVASPEDIKRVETLERQIQYAVGLDDFQPKLEAVLSDLVEPIKNLAAAKEQSEAHDALEPALIANIEAKLDPTLRAVSALREQYRLHKMVLEHTHGAEAVCPLCEQEVPADHAITEERLEKIRLDGEAQAASQKALELERTNLVARGNALSRAVLPLKVRVETLTEQAENYRAKIAEAKEVLGEGFDRKVAYAELTALKGKEVERDGRTKKLAELRVRESGLVGRNLIIMAQLTKSRAAIAEKPEIYVADPTRAGRIESLEKIQGIVNPRITVIRKLNEASQRAHDEAARLGKELEREKAALDTLFEDKRLTDLKMGIVPTEVLIDRSATLQDLQDRQAAWQQLVGQKRAAEDQCDSLLARQKDVEKKIEENRIRLGVIEELKQLQNLFGRTGLPAAYCRKQFQDLAALTGAILEELTCNFIVEPDPDVPLTFRFLRIDQENEAWLPQSKLSGGQRVRLTIAFLLAVQRLVIPEVGLLVLDEPSNHLDAESREALASLLREIGEKFANTDMQIIVCDHSPELSASFHKVVQL